MIKIPEWHMADDNSSSDKPYTVKYRGATLPTALKVTLRRTQITQRLLVQEDLFVNAERVLFSFLLITNSHLP